MVNRAKSSGHSAGCPSKELGINGPPEGPGTCPKHSGQNLDVFCMTHHALCCQECVSEKGSEHGKCKTIRFDDKENFRVIERGLAADFAKLESKVLKMMDTTLTSLKRKQDEVEESVQVVRAEINNLFTEIRRALDAREEALLRSLEEICEAASFDSIFEKINECDDRLVEIKTQQDAVILGEDGNDEPAHKIRIVQQECAVYAELSVVDDLEKQAYLMLKSVPKIVFERDEAALARMAKIGVLRIVRGPQNVLGKSEWWDTIALSWDDEGLFHYEVEMKKEEPEEKSGFLKVYEGEENVCRIGDLNPDTRYALRVRKRGVDDVSYTDWSDEVVVKTSGCSWGECPGDIDSNKEYVVYGNNSRKASFIGGDDSHGSWATVIGSTPIPLDRTVSWGVDILLSKENDGGGIFIGVAPSDIDQNFGDNVFKCGWYFDCYTSALCSGPPHNYWYKGYGEKNYVGTGECVGVEMDTTNGELSFVVNGENFGVAYEGIPLDKPLVPCVLLHFKGDSIELNHANKDNQREIIN